MNVHRGYQCVLTAVDGRVSKTSEHKSLQSKHKEQTAKSQFSCDAVVGREHLRGAGSAGAR